jgi:hypothetical protein
MRNPRTRGVAAAVCAAALTTTLTAAAQAPAPGGALRGTATVVPGRLGVLQVTGYGGPALGPGSRLTLTAPEPARVAAAPLADGGYAGAVADGGRSASYTFTGTAQGTPWQGGRFPFVLSVPAGTAPGTRLPGCTLRLTDADGTPREEGACTVTVGLPEPSLSLPLPGVPSGRRPAASGTAYPGALVSVRDQHEHEVCSATAAADGTWFCLAGTDLPEGPVRLQATATLNGVSAAGEQIDITVT